jgi:hypothetical protein
LVFDGTITLGSVLTLVGCVGTLVVGMWKFGQRIDNLEWRVGLMWRIFERRFGANGENMDHPSRRNPD